MIAAASLMQVACAELPEEPDEVVAEAEQAVTRANGLSYNGLSYNGLSYNGLSYNGLSYNGLSYNGLLMEDLKDPAAREMLAFVVGCALPDDVHFDIEIEGVTYGFDGELGLAPEWGHDNGSCNKSCQSWVSACVISRVNYLGQSLLISLRGKDNALETSLAERQTFTEREATYFGNIFTEPKQMQACLSPGQTEISRVCGPSLDDCPIEVVGQCDDVCNKERWDGSFDKCEDSSGKTQKGAITVFLDP